MSSADAPSPVVDLVVPYWGEPHYLREVVDSVLAQTDPRWRLTVIDDAFPQDWATEYLAGLADPRVVVRRHEQNLGIVATFQEAVSTATAPLVAVPGCDDRLGPDYVAVVAAAYERFPDVDIVQPGVRVVDGDGEPVRTLVDTVKQRLVQPRTSGPTVLAGERLATSLLHGDWLYWPSLVFRTEAVQAATFRTDLPVILDLALLIDLVYSGSRLLVEPTVCFDYRRHRASLSSTTLLDGVRFTDERRYFRDADEQMRERGWPRAARAARWHLTSRLHAATLLPGALLRRDAAGARSALRHLVRR